MEFGIEACSICDVEVLTGSEVSNNNYNKSSPLSCSCREEFFLDHTDKETASMIGT